jgi:hypothetical protein
LHVDNNRELSTSEDFGELMLFNNGGQSFLFENAQGGGIINEEWRI